MTGAIKGQSPNEIMSQLRKEWLTASLGSVVYWIPVMALNFRYMLPETRILFVTACSFLHKSALSWYSNRERVRKQRLAHENDNCLDVDFHGPPLPSPPPIIAKEFERPTGFEGERTEPETFILFEDIQSMDDDISKGNKG